MRVLNFFRSSLYYSRMAGNLKATRLDHLANEIESLISVVEKEIAGFVVAAVATEEKENALLQKEVLKSKEELINLQKKNGVSHIEIPGANISKTPKQEKKQEQKPKTAKISAPKTQEKAALPVHFGRLDLRMGKILEVNEHPQAENLYVETIDVGEEQPRTVISGIRKHISKENLLATPVVVACNLKPAKLRGVKSYGMLLCAVSDKSVEPLRSPADARPGQRLQVEGVECMPDAELNPKEKVFETVAKQLRINSDKVLVYNDVAVTCGDSKGFITTKNMSDCSVA
ncbi:aminoacyl tRNA synthase complex-interacting multifunctional protein 1 [Nilaparvata lugens]|uniref:aminoacyl tRNA synthase complex-interacting multifunctional protein 1 n=1 Tax=Nilaparvata lugens TaxID=108931 RepID=UPI00193E9DB4|nr:aminoacyl tRNA synthase complex-interacting multifunctional protein 1 [Nilaparvata lugens]